MGGRSVSIALRLPTHWQFGQAAGHLGGRAGAIERAVIQAIQRHVFADGEVGTDSVSPLFQAVAKFGAEWSTFVARQAEVQSLLAALGRTEILPPGPDAASDKAPSERQQAF